MPKEKEDGESGRGRGEGRETGGERGAGYTRARERGRKNAGINGDAGEAGERD